MNRNDLAFKLASDHTDVIAPMRIKYAGRVNTKATNGRFNWLGQRMRAVWSSRILAEVNSSRWVPTT